MSSGLLVVVSMYGDTAPWLVDTSLILRGPKQTITTHHCLLQGNMMAEQLLEAIAETLALFWRLNWHRVK